MRNITLSFILLPLLFACSKKSNSYVVTGILPDSSLNGRYIYITEYEDHKLLDSTLVTDGKFTFSGTVDTAFICRLDIEQFYANFILEPGEINVDMSLPNKPWGTPLNEGFRAYEKAIEQMSHQYKIEQDSIRALGPDTMEEILQDNQRRFMDKLNAFIEPLLLKNDNNALGCYMLWNWSWNLSPEEFEAIVNKVGPIVRNYKVIERILKEKEGVKASSPGKPFIDFSLETLSGDSCSFSDYIGKGKYVLVDFWATWCGPCRTEMPKLASLYEKYKADGLDMLGILVWNEQEVITPITKDFPCITWPVLCDKSDRSLKLYGIGGVPQIMLFAPDGTIVARDLRDDNLKKELKQIFGR